METGYPSPDMRRHGHSTAMSDYLVWGGGGHGKVVAEAARESGLSIAGFVDADESKKGMAIEPGGASVIMSETQLLETLLSNKLPPGLAGIILGVGNNRDRARCRLAAAENLLPVVVHPAAVVSRNATLGPGTVVMAAAVINADTRTGAGVVVNTGAIVEHDCTIGDDSHIAPGAVIAGTVTMGARVLVGAGAVIIPGISIGDDCIIGAGSVVIRDVPAGATVAGNPAKTITRVK